jgi:hypothetical protein
MRPVLTSLARLVGVVRAVSGNPGLLRVELAFVGFNVAEWATWVSILAFAYEVGGAAATGLVALVQLVPAALVAPLAAVAGDRFRRERVLLTVQYLMVGVLDVLLVVLAFEVLDIGGSGGRAAQQRRRGRGHRRLGTDRAAGGPAAGRAHRHRVRLLEPGPERR